VETKIEERNNPNLLKYREETVSIAYKFSAQIYKELGNYLKAIVLFGSSARKKSLSNDIDILLVLDDTKNILDQKFMEAYKIVVSQIIQRVSTKLHITTLKFTTFWEYMRAADPVAVNILKEGVPIIDSGFFEPMQVLLYQGRIRPTKEAIWSYYTRAPKTLFNSKWHILQATIDLYWSVVDSAHSALMLIGEVPP
jgi:predicted nucleotidyltransferase